MRLCRGRLPCCRLALLTPLGSPPPGVAYFGGALPSRGCPWLVSFAAGGSPRRQHPSFPRRRGGASSSRADLHAGSLQPDSARMLFCLTRRCSERRGWRPRLLSLFFFPPSLSLSPLGAQRPPFRPFHRPFRLFFRRCRLFVRRRRTFFRRSGTFLRRSRTFACLCRASLPEHPPRVGARSRLTTRSSEQRLAVSSFLVIMSLLASLCR